MLFYFALLKIHVASSSLARGGGSPIGCRPKSRIRKIPLASETAFLHWNGLKSDLKHLLKEIFRKGANL